MRLQVFYVVTLGILQGLTEFLPVSSSGHLVLLQKAFGFSEPEILFDICVHVGTLAAVVFVFFREIRSLLMTLIRLPGLWRSAGGPAALISANEDVKLLLLIIVGSVPTALLGIFFHHIADQIFGAVWMVGIMLLITGTFLWLTRGLRPEGRKLSQVSVKDALMIGLAQGMAILPGISRSGSTISAALFLGVDREVAGRYSFLLSIPAILGALILGMDSAAIQTSISMEMVLLGALIAAAVGYVALKILLALVKQGRLYRFAPYCWVLGVTALILSEI